MRSAERLAVSPALPGVYGTPPSPAALRPTPATVGLARSQVQALLAASPGYLGLDRDRRRQLAQDMVKISSYIAELARDDWYQSSRLGQRPVVRQRRVVEAPVARAQAAGDEFRPAAANQIARVTQETLNAIAFPTFVADLIQSTFNAIVNATIQQMEAYTQLLSNVSRTVDQFMNENISDNQARDWLAQRYPEHLVVRGGSLVPREGADERPLPDWRSDLGLSEEVDLSEDAIEETLVPAARRKLAQSRLQTLSTMVLMGVQRIVVTGGKIRATMGFHIDTTDRAHEERASDFDFRTGASGQFGWGPWSAAASMSVAYVRSTRADSDAELNVDADLTGEVDIRFKSDYFPLSRFADSANLDRIRSNTAVPAANEPTANALGATPGEGEVGRYTSPRSRRTPRREPRLRAIGEPLPEVRRPDAPEAPPPPGRPEGGGGASRVVPEEVARAVPGVPESDGRPADAGPATEGEGSAAEPGSEPSPDTGSETDADSGAGAEATPAEGSADEENAA